MRSKDDTSTQLHSLTIQQSLMTMTLTSPSRKPRVVRDDSSIRSHGSMRSSASLSSTFTADNSPKKKSGFVLQSPTCAPKARSRRQCVRFNERLNKWHKSNLCIDDLQYLWFSAEDYMDFHVDMVSAVAAITTVPENAESCAKVLTQVFDACIRVEMDNNNTSNNRIFVLTKEEKRELKRTFKETPDLLGLERAVSSMISQDRMERREALVESIEDLQSCGWPDAETEARRLHEASVKKSRTSRFFARFIALGIAPSGAVNSTNKPHRSRARSHSPLMVASN